MVRAERGLGLIAWMLLGLFLLGMISFLLGVVLGESFGTITTKEVTCYDRDSNEIIGATCVNIMKKYPAWAEYLYVYGLVAGMVGILAAILYSFIKDDKHG